MNIFEEASKKKLRFKSNVGELTVENLWDLPLTSKQKVDLDTVAKAVNAELKSETEESFVTTTVNAKKKVLELQLEIVKYIIAEKVAENESRKLAAEKSAKRAAILEALAEKEIEDRKGKTREQLLAELEAL